MKKFAVVIGLAVAAFVGYKYFLVPKGEPLKKGAEVLVEPEMLDFKEESDAVSLYKKGRFRDALIKFAEDHNDRNLAYSGMCYWYLKEKDKARETWEKLMKEFPQSPYTGDAHYYLAQQAKENDQMESYRKSLEESAKFYSLPDHFSGGRAALELGNYYLQKGDKAQAWKWYSMAILGNFPKDARNIKLALKEKLDTLVDHLLLSTFSAGTPGFEFCEYYEVESNDNFTTIGKRYKLEAGFVQWLNRRQKDLVRVGEKIRVIQGPVALEVNKTAYLLVVHLANENFPPYYLRGYQVGLGGDKTPIKNFTIQEKIKDPDWYRPGGGIVRYGQPGNPLGTRWLDFKEDSLGIHGTTDPDSIAKDMSNGCVRMLNKEVEELFDLIPRGTRVNIKGS